MYFIRILLLREQKFLERINFCLLSGSRERKKKEAKEQEMSFHFFDSAIVRRFLAALGMTVVIIIRGMGWAREARPTHSRPLQRIVIPNPASG